MVLDHTGQSTCDSRAVEAQGFVDGAFPDTGACRPQAHLSVRLPSAVVNPLVDVAGQAVDLPHTPRTFGGLYGTGDEVSDGVRARRGEGLVCIEAQNPSPPGGGIGAVFRGGPPFPCTGFDSGAGGLGQLDRPIAAARIKNHDLVGQSADGVEQTGQVVRLIPGDDHHTQPRRSVVRWEGGGGVHLGVGPPDW